MKTIKITRYLEQFDSTLGIMEGLSEPIYTLEDAWRDNKRNVSCIPAGTYKVTPHGWEKNTPFKYKRTWLINGVPNRSAILIHAGNTHQDTQGCILVGKGLSIADRAMVTNSRTALEMLRREIGEASFTLEIVDRTVRL